MQSLEKFLAVLGMALFFGGLFWARGPAVIPAEYAAAFGVAVIGLLLATGPELIRRHNARKKAGSSAAPGSPE